MPTAVANPAVQPESAVQNPHLQRLARLGVRLFDAQLVCVCYVDEHGRVETLVGAGPLVRQAGEGTTESIDHYVSHVIGQASPLIVGDAPGDARFAGLPVVTGGQGVRSFAGQRMADATCALCIMATRARAFSGADLETLRDLASLIESELHRVGDSDIRRGLGRREVIPDKSRRELALSLSHDFRSTLSGIIGFAELMSDDTLSPQQLREFAVDLHPAALRLNQMISDLLDLGLLPDG